MEKASGTIYLIPVSDSSSNFVNWSAIIFQGFVNFVVPCILYYQAVKMYPTIPFFHQKHLQDTAQDQTHHDEDACSEGQEEPLYDEVTELVPHD